MRFTIWIFGILIVSLLSSCVDREQKIRENLNQGISLLHKNMHTEALAHFDAVLELDSTNAEAYLQISNVYYAKKKYRKAIAFLDKSTTFNPSYGQAYKSKAQIYFYLGDRDAACANYLKAEELGVKNLHNYTKHCK
jgi:tetratricopeptide (TPR) repeat protein